MDNLLALITCTWDGQMLENELEMGEENHCPNEHMQKPKLNQRKQIQNTCNSKERERDRDTCTQERWWF